MPDAAFWYTAAVLYGAAIGSFLNVCIYRMPLGMSIIRPPSSCPHCGHGIRFYENIPILSYIWLRGRCSGCGSRISLRYPFVEALNGLLYAAALWRFGLSVTTLLAMALLSSLVVITFIDLDHQIIPDEISIPMTPIGIVAASFWFVDPFSRGHILGWKMSLIGASAGFFFFYAIAFLGEKVFKKEAMGGGDIKLMAGLGAFLGPKGVCLTTFAGSLIGAVIGSIVQAVQGRDRGTPIPFGPFLAGAAVVTLLFGQEIFAWYWGLHGW